MRNVFVLLTMLFAFAFLSAQTGSTPSSTDQSSGSQAGASDHAADMHAAHKKGGSGGSTLKGCLSGPNNEGVYELKSGKRTVEVGGLDDLSKHVGHTVKLHGSWAKGSDIGEKESAENKEGAAGEKSESKAGGEEKGERHFKVASIDHVSDTCTASSGGMGGHHHKKGGEAGEAGSASQPSPTPKQ